MREALVILRTGIREIVKLVKILVLIQYICLASYFKQNYSKMSNDYSLLLKTLK